MALMRICFPVIVRKGQFLSQEYEGYQISFRDTVMWRQAMGLPVVRGMMNLEPDVDAVEEEDAEQEEENETVNGAVAEQSVTNLQSRWSYSSSELDEDDDEDQGSERSGSPLSPTVSQLLDLSQILTPEDRPTQEVEVSVHSQSDSPSEYSQPSLPRNQPQPDQKPDDSQTSLRRLEDQSDSPSEYSQPSLPRHQPQPQPQPSRASSPDSLGYANEDERIQDQRAQALLTLEGKRVPTPNRDYTGPLAFIFESMYCREQRAAKMSMMRRVLNKLLCIRPPPPPPVRTASEIAHPRGWAVLQTLITSGLSEGDRREFPAYKAGQAAHFFLVDHNGPRGEMRIRFKRNLEVCSTEGRVEALELMEERSWEDVIMVAEEEHNVAPRWWETTREVKILKWGEDMF